MTETTVTLTAWERGKLAQHAASSMLTYLGHHNNGRNGKSGLFPSEQEEMGRWKALAEKLAPELQQAESAEAAPATSPQLRPTRKAKEFMRANDQSPVYAGAAHEGGGGTYALTDKRSFNLSLMDCRSLPEGYPKWVHDEEVHRG